MQKGETQFKSLPNGRKYRIRFDGEYVGGEYPFGGFHICTWEPRLNKGLGGWLYVENSPNEECLQNFFKACGRLPRIPKTCILPRC